MATYMIEIVFDGLDSENNTLERLARANISATAPLGDGLMRVTASIDAPNATSAAQEMLASMRAAVPQADPVRAYRDLVSVSDIAARIGVTREAVRHWSSGRRRDGSFPSPAGAPSGSQVWEWSAVHSWMKGTLGLWDGLKMPGHDEFAQIDLLVVTLALISADEASAVDAEEWSSAGGHVSTRVETRTHEADNHPDAEFRRAERWQANLQAA